MTTAFKDGVDWFLRLTDGKIEKLGVDLGDEGSMARLLARAFVHGENNRQREFNSFFTKTYYMPWRNN